LNHEKADRREKNEAGFDMYRGTMPNISRGLSEATPPANIWQSFRLQAMHGEQF
jgi:hypothetical protein